MLFVAFLLSFFALVSFIRTPLIYKVTNLPFFCFAVSFFGHSFAGPLLVVSGLMTFLTATVLAPADLAFTLCAGSSAIFAYNLFQAHRSQQELQEVSLGQGVDRDLPSFLETALLPLKIRQPGVKRQSNISYGDAGVRNLLDIYVPDPLPAEPLPILIHVHGGAWVVGQKKQQSQPLIQYLASRGWMVVDINYRLGPANKFPVIVADVLRAVGWVKQNAAQYGGDPEFVALTGGSAGGHLTALVALAREDNRFKEGFRDLDCAVDAAAPIYGVYDFLEPADGSGALNEGTQDFLKEQVIPVSPEEDRGLWEALSPIYQVHAEAPPMLVVHGKKDTLAKYEGAERFVDALRRVSRNGVELASLPSGEHAYDAVNSPPTPAHVRAVERFLVKARRNKQMEIGEPSVTETVQAAE